MLRRSQTLQLEAIGRQIADAAFIEGLLIPPEAHGSPGEMGLREIVADECCRAAREAGGEMFDASADEIGSAIFGACRERLDRLGQVLAEVAGAGR